MTPQARRATRASPPQLDLDHSNPCTVAAAHAGEYANESRQRTISGRHVTIEAYRRGRVPSSSHSPSDGEGSTHGTLSVVRTGMEAEQCLISSRDAQAVRAGRTGHGTMELRWIVRNELCDVLEWGQG